MAKEWPDDGSKSSLERDRARRPVASVDPGTARNRPFQDICHDP